MTKGITPVQLSFYCGICAKRLTDASALFTSCGHFFCANSPKCSKLKEGNAAGNCEQCAQRCDAALLSNRAQRYGERVRRFIFADFPNELRTFVEMAEFREKHLHMLGDNASSIASRLVKTEAENTNLRAQLNSAKTQLEAICRERDSLRSERDSLISQLSSRQTTNHHSAPRISKHLTRLPSVELVEPIATHRNTTNNNNNSTHNISFRHKKNNPLPARYKWPSPAQPSQPAPSAVADSRTMRPSKRRWRESSVVAPTSSQHFVSSRTTRATATTKLTGISRFARGNAPSIAAAASGGRTAATDGREPGDWQRRVSSVPRPTVTQNLLSRRTAKRQRQGVNPVLPPGW